MPPKKTTKTKTPKPALTKRVRANPVKKILQICFQDIAANYLAKVPRGDKSAFVNDAVEKAIAKEAAATARKK